MTDSQTTHRQPSRIPAILLAAVAGFATLSTAYAALETGEWSGTVTPPEGNVTPAVFRVSEADGETTITVSLMGMDIQFFDIDIGDDRITFAFTPGPVVRCELELQEDASYYGPCVDDAGDEGYISMVPPE